MPGKKRNFCDKCGCEIFDRPQHAKYCKECSDKLRELRKREHSRQDYLMQNYVVCGLLLAPEEFLQRVETEIEQHGKVMLS